MKIIAFSLFFTTLLSLWFYPAATPILGLVALLFSLAISVQPIFEKHKQVENSRSKIFKEIVILILTISLVIIIGGIAGLLVGRVAGAYVEVHWQGFGMAAGFVSAILVSFAIGYTVRWGAGKLGKG